MNTAYSHIINRPHHVSRKHPHMSNYGRAAQFAAFKALDGFEEEIAESARYVECRQPLTEAELAALDAAFCRLLELEQPRITVTYFIPDAQKAGGVYVQYTGYFRFLDRSTQRMKFVKGRAIPLDAVAAVQFTEEE